MMMLAASGYPYDIKDVCNICGIELKQQKKGWVDARCPYNQNQDIRINIDGNSFSCFHQCSDCPHHPEPGQASVTDLYCLAKSIPDRKRAHREIMEILYGERIVSKTEYKPVSDAPKTAEESPMAPIEVRDKTYRTLLMLCPLSKKHASDLRERGLTNEDIRNGGYKSVPQTGVANICRTLRYMGCELEGVPGFYKTISSGNFSMADCKPGYFIPYYDRNGLIQGLQIRYDVKITPDMTDEDIRKAKAKRYRWFSSGQFRPGRLGTSAKNWPFYGRPGSLHKDGNEFAVYATEGGLKANVASVLCERVFDKSRSFVAIPGVTCYTSWNELLQELKNAGVTTIVDAFDSDRASNVSVNNAIARLMDIARDNNFNVLDWKWGTEHKGCDDYLLARLKQRLIA